MSQDKYQEVQIRKSLSSKENYSQTKQYRQQIRDGNTKVITSCLSAITAIFKDGNALPISKLLAVKFAKDLVELYEDEVINQVQFTILPQFEKVGMYKKESNDDDRGRTYFQIEENLNNDLASIGNSFLRLILECIWVWAKWFPVEPDTRKISAYRIVCQRMVMSGVKFPAIKYFDLQEVKQNLPETLIPIEMITELKMVLARDLGGKKVLTIQQVFDSLKKCTNGRKAMGNLESPKTYANKLHQIVKKVVEGRVDIQSRRSQSKQRVITQQDEFMPIKTFQQSQSINIMGPMNQSSGNNQSQTGNQQMQQSLLAPPQYQLQRPQSPVNNRPSLIQPITPPMHNSNKVSQQDLEAHFNLNNILAEKDQLHNEIQFHIKDKEYLVKEIQRIQQEKSDLQKIVGVQRTEISKLKSQLDKLLFDQGQPQDDIPFAPRSNDDTDDQRELRRQIQKMELQLNRVQAQCERQRQIIQSHEQAISEHILHKQEIEENYFKSQSEKEEIKGQAQSHMLSMIRQQSQIDRLKEQLKDFREKTNDFRKQLQDSKQKHMQDLQELQGQLLTSQAAKMKAEDDLAFMQTALNMAQQEVAQNKQYMKQYNEIMNKSKTEKEYIMQQHQELMNEVQSLRKSQMNSTMPRLSKMEKPYASQVMMSKTQNNFMSSGGFKSGIGNMEMAYSMQEPRAPARSLIVPPNPDVFQISQNLINDKFRQACFKNKASLFDDGIIQIGTICNFDPSKPGNDVIQIYFTNRTTNNSIDVNLQLKQGNQLILTNEPFQNPLVITRQFPITIGLRYISIPYGTASIVLNYEGVKDQEIAIPYPIFKLFQYQQLQSELFPEVFALISDQFILHEGAMDLMRLFPQFTNFPQPDRFNQEVISAQVKLHGQGPVITIRISRLTNLGTIEVDAGQSHQIGRFIIQTLTQLMS